MFCCRCARFHWFARLVSTISPRSEGCVAPPPISWCPPARVCFQTPSVCPSRCSLFGGEIDVSPRLRLVSVLHRVCPPCCSLFGGVRLVSASSVFCIAQSAPSRCSSCFFPLFFLSPSFGFIRVPWPAEPSSFSPIRCPRLPIGSLVFPSSTALGSLSLHLNLNLSIASLPGLRSGLFVVVSQVSYRAVSYGAVSHAARGVCSTIVPTAPKPETVAVQDDDDSPSIARRSASSRRQQAADRCFD